MKKITVEEANRRYSDEFGQVDLEIYGKDDLFGIPTVEGLEIDSVEDYELARLMEETSLVCSEFYGKDNGCARTSGFGAFRASWHEYNGGFGNEIIE